jgi:HEAT repeat protein
MNKIVRVVSEHSWIRITLAVVLLVVGLAPVGAPILSDTVARTSTPVQPAYAFRYENQANGTAVIQRSPEGTQNWSNAGSLPAAVLQMSEGRASEELYARSTDNVWRSADAGASWTKTAALASRPLSMAVGHSSSGLVLVGTETKGLYISTDSGANWRPAGGALTLNGPGTLAVPAVALNASDDNIIYATVNVTMASTQGTRSTTDVLVSSDGAGHWLRMTPAQSSGQGGVSTPPSGLQLTPDASQPLAVQLSWSGGSQVYSLRDASGLVAQLDSADAGQRAAAARSLGLLGDRSATPALLNHLGDSNVAAGERVAEAIGRLGDTTAGPQLLDLLTHQDETLRARAAYALGLMKYQGAVPLLGKILLQDGPFARRRAAEALGTIASPAAINALMVPLNDTDLTPARQAALQGLELAGRPAAPQVTIALQNETPTIRRNAAQALGYMRADIATPALARALSDTDAGVRTQAAWALGEIGTPPAYQALAQASRTEKVADVRQVQTEALTQARASAYASQTSGGLAPLEALNRALLEVPASRWTLMALLVVLAVALLALRPRRPQPSQVSR